MALQSIATGELVLTVTGGIWSTMAGGTVGEGGREGGRGEGKAKEREKRRKEKGEGRGGRGKGRGEGIGKKK